MKLAGTICIEYIANLYIQVGQNLSIYRTDPCHIKYSEIKPYMSIDVSIKRNWQ